MCRGQRPLRGRPGDIGIGGDEPRTCPDQPDRLGDRLERIAPGFTEHDEVWTRVGERVADLSAVLRPASPTTYAEPPGNWSSRNDAVATADVQIDASGTCRVDRAKRAARSRGVNIELFISTKKSVSMSRCKNSAAPGSACSSRTRTPIVAMATRSTHEGTPAQRGRSGTMHRDTSAPPKARGSPQLTPN